MNTVKGLVSSLFNRSLTEQDQTAPPHPDPISASSGSSYAASDTASECSTVRIHHRSETPVTKVNAWHLATPSLDSEPSITTSRPIRKRGATLTASREVESLAKKRRKMDKTRREFDKLSIMSPALQADIPMPSIEKTVSPAPSFLERMGGWSRQSVQSNDSTDADTPDSISSAEVSMEMELGEVDRDDRYDTAPIASSTSTGPDPNEAIDDDEKPRPPYKSYPPPTASEVPILRAARLAAASTLRTQGWPEHCVTLFTKLQLRGLEPTLQHHLLSDFGVLPAALFTDPAADPTASTAHVKPAGILTSQPACQAAFHHVRALEWLMKTGQRVRGCVDGPASKGGEHWQRFTADMYRRWALEDAGVLQERMKRGGVPHNLAIVELRRHVAHTAASMDAATLAALETLEQQWTERLGEAVRGPALYALVMTGSMVAVVALRQEGDADGDGEHAGRVDVEGSRLRPVAVFDWGDDMMDVWNAFAVAITVVHCRDLLIQTLIWNVLKPVDEPQGAFTLGAQVGGRYKEEDPDA